VPNGRRGSGGDDVGRETQSVHCRNHYCRWHRVCNSLAIWQSSALHPLAACCVRMRLMQSWGRTWGWHRAMPSRSGNAPTRVALVDPGVWQAACVTEAPGCTASPQSSTRLVKCSQGAPPHHPLTPCVCGGTAAENAGPAPVPGPSQVAARQFTLNLAAVPLLEVELLQKGCPSFSSQIPVLHRKTQLARARTSDSLSCLVRK
jgi:hypothetical protein